MPESTLYDKSGRYLAKIVDDGSTSRIYDRSGACIGRIDSSSGLIFDKFGNVVARATGDITGVVALLKGA